SNGSQILTGACASTPLGAIPTVDNMISSLITHPASGSTIDASTNVNVVIDVFNLETGFFNDPNTQYYLVPQTLNAAGIIQGHSHVTVQQLISKTTAPDPRTFAFFKGLDNSAADGHTLSVIVPNGTFKFDGLYRMCSMAGTDSHQPPIMPVAKCGSQDDCIRANVINSNV
ncbi:hypothetical protein BDK51DRAFT_24012, partial [Blyttiomyces helicus]